MDDARGTLKPLTAIQLLNTAIRCPIASDEPQPQSAFIDPLSRLLASWMLTYSHAPEFDTLTTLCKTRAYVCDPHRITSAYPSPTLK
jgi:hypothetical protein